MSTRVGRVNIGKNSRWVALLIIFRGPALWRERGGARRCEGTKVGFIVPWQTRCFKGRELILIWRLGSGGGLEVEEGVVGGDGVEVASSRCTILLSLLWFDGMTVGGGVAKGLDEVVVLGNIAGKHVAGTVRNG